MKGVVVEGVDGGMNVVVGSRSRLGLDPANVRNPRARRVEVRCDGKNMA